MSKEAEVLSRCDIEPIHLIPFIQHSGVLFTFAVNPDELRSQSIYSPTIVQASANTAQHGFGTAETLLGKRAADIFGEEYYKVAELLADTAKAENLRPSATVNIADESCLPSLDSVEKGGGLGEAWWVNVYSAEDQRRYLDNLTLDNPQALKCKSIRVRNKYYSFSCFAANHGVHRILVVEIEPLEVAEIQSLSALHVLEDINETAEELLACEKLEEVYEIIINRCASTLGFDRTMLYKFSEEGYGEVIAEKTSDKVKTQYLGLRFPRSDIPDQARLLLARNVVRSFSGVSKDPVELVPKTVDGMLVDLSDSKLRFHSLIHIKYLKNMGTEASVSCTIVVRGKIWGLLALHHQSEKPLSRADFIKLRSLMSTCGTAIQILEQRSEERTVKEVREVLSKQDASMDPNEHLKYAMDAICRFLRADSVVLMKLTRSEASIVECFGVDVPEDFALEVYKSCENSRAATEEFFSTPSIAKSFPELWQNMTQRFANSYLPAGVMALNCVGFVLLLFRKSQVQLVRWAGEDAMKLAKLKKEGIKKLEPRDSFQEYCHAEALSSLAWTRQDRIIAQTIIAGLTLTKGATQQNLGWNEGLLLAASGELKTPFDGIGAILQMLENRDDLADHVKNMIKNVRSSSTNLVRILENVLVAGKLEQGEIELKKSIFTPKELLSPIEALVGAATQQLGIRLHFSPPIHSSDTELIFADKDRLLQVLFNLVNNAVKFSKGSADQITVSWRTFDGLASLLQIIEKRFNGDYACSQDFAKIEEVLNERPLEEGDSWLYMSVADEGEEIAQENLRNLFRKYGIIDTSVTRRQGGTGLGLAICMRLCNLMDGTIWCCVPLSEGSGKAFEFAVRVSNPARS